MKKFLLGVLTGVSGLWALIRLLLHDWDFSDAFGRKR